MVKMLVAWKGNSSVSYFFAFRMITPSSGTLDGDSAKVTIHGAFVVSIVTAMITRIMTATVIPMILGCSESSFRTFMFRPTPKNAKTFLTVTIE
jgi:hypothetical protein